MAESDSHDLDELRSQVTDLELNLGEIELTKHGLENASQALQVVSRALRKIFDQLGVDPSAFEDDLAQLDDLAGRLV